MPEGVRFDLLQLMPLKSTKAAETLSARYHYACPRQSLTRLTTLPNRTRVLLCLRSDKGTVTHSTQHGKRRPRIAHPVPVLVPGCILLGRRNGPRSRLRRGRPDRMSQCRRWIVVDG